MPTLFGLAKSPRHIAELIVLTLIGLACVGFAILNTLATEGNFGLYNLAYFMFSVEQAAAIFVVCVPMFRHILCTRPHKSMKIRGLISISTVDSTVSTMTDAKSIV